MKPAPITNNFKKAMGATILTAGAALADAHRLIDTAHSPKREEIQKELRPSMEFCQLLLEPVNEHGPCFAEIPGFAENYCRKQFLTAAKFYRKALKSDKTVGTAAKRLAHIAGLIEGNLKRHLDPETAKLCWFGD
jgi:hypothetical protein